MEKKEEEQSLTPEQVGLEIARENALICEVLSRIGVSEISVIAPLISFLPVFTEGLSDELMKTLAVMAQRCLTKIANQMLDAYLEDPNRWVRKKRISEELGAAEEIKVEILWYKEVPCSCGSKLDKARLYSSGIFVSCPACDYRTINPELAWELFEKLEKKG